MTVRNWPRERCGRAPIRSISAVTRSMAACEAFCCMTMIKAKLPKQTTSPIDAKSGSLVQEVPANKVVLREGEKSPIVPGPVFGEWIAGRAVPEIREHVAQLVEQRTFN